MILFQAKARPMSQKGYGYSIVIVVYMLMLDHRYKYHTVCIDDDFCKVGCSYCIWCDHLTLVLVRTRNCPCICAAKNLYRASPSKGQGLAQKGLCSILTVNINFISWCSTVALFYNSIADCCYWTRLYERVLYLVMIVSDDCWYGQGIVCTLYYLLASKRR